MKAGSIKAVENASSVIDKSLLKRGAKFIHKSWLDGDMKPLVCEVTRVAYGAVYWKCEGERKARMYFRIEQADKYVKEIL